MTNIGPTFGLELSIFGLQGLPITWTERGVYGRENLTEEQNELLDDVLHAHNPERQLAPLTISDRQFFQQLAVMNTITFEEALSAVKVGAIPTTLQSFVDTLPPDQKFAAEMLLSGATIFERNHPMTLALGAGMGWTNEQLDALWTAAALL